MITKTRGVWAALALFAVLITSAGIYLYSPAQQWFSDTNSKADVTGYADSISGMSTTARNALLDRANKYNATLVHGNIADPMSVSSDRSDAAYQDYLTQLAVPGTDVIGQVTVPSIGISLPIYHGTDEDSALKLGVGHLFGTDLPTGQPGTHAVLPGHSGSPKPSTSPTSKT